MKVIILEKAQEFAMKTCPDPVVRLPIDGFLSQCPVEDIELADESENLHHVKGSNMSQGSVSTNEESGISKEQALQAAHTLKKYCSQFTSEQCCEENICGLYYFCQNNVFAAETPPCEWKLDEEALKKYI